MALTRAQLLMGDNSLGTVLTGQVQGVRQGPGISIDANGIITVNSQTVVGLMKLGQTPATAGAAYNGYEWPTAAGAVGQQLEITNVAGGVATLSWADADGIDWTAKGQLIVGTGVSTDTLLNVGADGSILIADSGTPSGLAYTSNFVATSGPTGAAYIPSGPTASQPLTPPTGSLRYNSTLTAMEFYNGTAWEVIASSANNGFVEKTSDTGAAIMPAGTTVQQPGGPSAGFLRFNSDKNTFEFWSATSSAWLSVAASATGSFVAQTVPTTGSPSAVIPTGTTAQQQTAPAPAGGYLRYNTSSNNLEFFNTTSWVSVGGGIPDLGLNLSSTNSLLKAATPVATTPPTVGNNAGQAITGSMYWDAQYGALFVRYADGDGSQWVMVNGNNVQTGTLNFPNGPAAGATYAAPNGLTYTFDGTKGVWTCPAGAQLGLGLALNGGFIKVSIPVASTPPTAGTTVNQAMDGSMYWDSAYGAIFVRYNDGSSTQWVQASGGNVNGGGLNFPDTPAGGSTYVAPNGVTYTYDGTKGVWTQPLGGGGGGVTSVTGTAPIVSSGGSTPAISITAATTGAPGSAQLATAAEAAGGTSTTRVSTPAYTVPKDTSGMGGAALLPSGGNYGGTTTGMFRFNTTSNHTEFYDGTSWRTSINRTGDQVFGGLDFGPVSAPAISGGASFGSFWLGSGSGNVTGYALGFASGGVITLSRTGDAPVGLNRVDGAGAFINLYNANTLAGYIGLNATGWFSYQVTTTPLLLSSTAAICYIQGTDATSPIIFQSGVGTNVAYVSNAGTFVTVSDSRQKTDVQPLSYGLSQVQGMQPKTYKLLHEIEDDKPEEAPLRMGLIAQELQQIVPEAVSEIPLDDSSDTQFNIDYLSLIPVLVNAIKELKQEFDDYKATHS